ncbi:Ubiquitin-conjugating enzyme E2 6 [Nakaseomyces glabratus]|nr:Ubiquitin-conjugating enzyme E2 6 [Nakaseomyces glabratus]KTB13228.1 Ubiquitin-conjugating enzyme E2 6 [Nakaseomyces glabratus]
MATKQAQKRLTKEYKMMVENPPPFIIARPNEENILEWHYVISGPPDTPYDGGQYHGTLTFPSDYPYKPPAIRMITPNGRFKENTRLCLSMSDYHPDTWNPGWSVATILNGLLSFMTGDESTTGSITTTQQEKKILAKKSMYYNTFNSTRFKLVFPEIVEKNITELQRRKQEEKDMSMFEKKEDPLVKAAREKAIEVKDIVNPEDRIRAEQALKELEKQHNDKPNGSFSMFYIGVALFLFLVGLFMK